MKISKLSGRGDTIIEVLVALAIVGAVLAGAYAVASRSLRTARNAQERSEALKVAEGQIEKLKYLASDYLNTSSAASNVFITSEPFCIKDTGGSFSVVTGMPSGVFGTDLFTDNFAGYGADCTSGFYHFAIKYTASGVGSTDNFQIAVRWERLGGTRDEIIIPYRLHQ